MVPAQGGFVQWSAGGVEALLRWRDPEHGLVSPAEFIPLAERTGLIIPLGELVLDLACAQLASWRAADCLPGPLAINVAALQIERSDYVTSLATALARYDLPAQLLEVEITESLLMESQQQACAVLAQLQAMGVATAVDDFGTGYSSLAYLRSLPIDHLKIDRAFIRTCLATTMPSPLPARSSTWAMRWAFGSPPKASKPRSSTIFCAMPDAIRAKAT